jgi:GNAT superfamily N-acetyltransferase
MTHIRPATKADVPEIIALARTLIEQHAAMDPVRFACEQPAETYATWLDDLMARSDALVLVSGPEDVPPRLHAYLIAEQCAAQPRFWATPSVWVHDLYVHPQARGGALARAMIERAMLWAQSRGVGQVRVLCADANEHARAFFGARGFRPTAHELALDL